MASTILITGCRRGIGRDSAMTLAARGHRVLATTHHEQDALELSESVLANKLPIETFKLDITEPADREKALTREFDVLVNNAALGETGSLAEVDVARVRDVFEVNVFGTLELTRLALARMMEHGSGRVIFISSLGGRIVMPFYGPYVMSKFALSSGAEVMRRELARLRVDVHVSVVEPGGYHTGFNQEMVAKKYEWMDEGSYFYGLIDQLKADEERRFRFTEQSKTDSIVKQIVHAVEAEKPRLRYTAPWWQGFGVRLLRAFGR